jgi:putative transposase
VALIKLAERYNRTWLVARHGYKTPNQVTAEQLSVAKANTAELSLAA